MSEDASEPLPAPPQQQQQQLSPISAMLQTLGITREDLSKHSNQMRQFLTTDTASSLSGLLAGTSTSNTSWNANSKPSSSMTRSMSRSTSGHARSPSPGAASLGGGGDDDGMRRHSMDAVIERKNRKKRKERKQREKMSVRSPSVAPLFTAVASTPATFEYDVFTVQPQLASAPASTPVAPQWSPVQHTPETHENAWNDASETPQQPTSAPQPITPVHKYYRADYEAQSNSAQRAAPIPKLTRLPFGKPPAPASVQPRTSQNLTPRLNKIRQNATSPIPAQQHAFSTPYPQDTSPLPPSSPLPASSPVSSPIKPIVNTVSSPGPMGPLPDEEEYDNLPYTLPPGPYSRAKPELSYAALVGQAVLSSHEHRLTLQEIYDWITIVYPFFSRTETTWMNSIRHVLSTTACFRKVMRERSQGRTLWAIWDEDLECFKDGGFKKQYCKDMSGENGSRKSKKRGAGQAALSSDDSGHGANKRPRTSETTSVIPPVPGGTSNVNPFSRPPLPGPNFYPPPPTSHAAPIFPRPSTNHQPYYQAHVHRRALPTEIMFPPLTTSSSHYHPHFMPPHLHQLHHPPGVSPAPVSIVSSAPSSTAPSSSDGFEDQLMYPPEDDSSPPPPSSATSLSVPSLTPGCSSSSPPSRAHSTPPDVLTLEEAHALSTPALDGRGHSVPNEDTTVRVEALEPGLLLYNHYNQKDKGKQKETNIFSSHKMPAIPEPVSPTPTFNILSRIQKQPKDAGAGPFRPFTPPRPSTPPRLSSSAAEASNILGMSPVRTPISHKGLHMSPNASLAHYKLNLDPPPPHDFSSASDKDKDNADPMFTPSRRRAQALLQNSIFGFPVTPKRNLFGSSGDDSPFRTPGSGKVSIWDPHDPSTAIEEEIKRMADRQPGDSPDGLFGKRSSGLLYDSPGVFSSPSRWSAKMWS